MAKVLLDTDILSEIIKQRDPAVVAQATEYLAEERRFTISVLSVMEIVYGFHRLAREDRIDQFLTLISVHQVLPFEIAAATLAGRIYADLERRGTPIGLADVMIGAVGLHHGLPVVTGNTSHFTAIREAGYPLEIRNWRAAPPGS
ncbi:MAG: PIN domain-containing protein [Myxococcales bacterium]|nr:PIN domain-containing protein [Myxococcales bacterium]